ncbi:hypothetical protein ACFSKU_11010 [Pontibacter silvestris]|uniref:Uncharacterized protein n=1 Tax=Pontibacter silvestris TaxID=2305183 RepID=A0ABW4WXF6_9BACT|nr:hypothetical protein [Pontibacter silvestris]MCC9138463.1 hypothetical protein [Pontibacter silvestris]
MGGPVSGTDIHYGGLRGIPWNLAWQLHRAGRKVTILLLHLAMGWSHFASKVAFD